MSARTMILAWVFVLGACSAAPDEPDAYLLEVEPNDDWENALSIPLESRIEGQMAPGDSDYFHLSIPDDFDGHKITVEVVDRDGFCFEGVDPNLEIFAEDGQTSLYFQEDGHADFCAQLHFPVLAGQGYYIKVGTAYILSGAYYLQISRGGPGSLVGELPAEWQRLPDTQRSRDGMPAKMAFDDQYLVWPAPGYGPAHFAHHLKSLPEIERLRQVGDGRFHLIRLPEGGVDTLLSKPFIGGLSANGLYQIEDAPIPSDPEFSRQWNLKVFPGANLQNAWSISQGSSQGVVAVLDTGFDGQHPELQEKAIPGYDFISHMDNAADGDGPDGDAHDALHSGHGSHVSGIIAAQTDNAVGIASAGWQTHFMPLRVCGAYGCTDADIIEALFYAAGLESIAGAGQETPRADVVNLSLAGPYICAWPMQNAIHATMARGMTVVAAGGNYGDEAGAYSPVSCDGVIGVAASDGSGKRYLASNYGDGIELAAPGSAIYSTVDGVLGSYASLSGTSMAAPHISALVALLRAEFGALDWQQITDILQDSAHESVQCEGCGAGILDGNEALLLAETLNPNAAAPLWIAQAQKVDGDQSYASDYISPGGQFRLLIESPGEYRLYAGIDRDGSRHLSIDERELQSPTAYFYSFDGEDYVASF